MARAVESGTMDNRSALTAVRWHGGAASLLARLIDSDGTARHPWYSELVNQRPRRDLADAVHAICILYGHQPGMADEALGRAAMPDAHDWLAEVGEGFAQERAYLAQLTAAAGPLPSTPGHASAHATITAQAHALTMLARSDRGGCAVGAVAALVGDWYAIRLVLDAAAERFGIPHQPSALPDPDSTARLVAELGATPACERAIGFGAQQLLAQHRGLWSLLEARASARKG